MRSIRKILPLGMVGKRMLKQKEKIVVVGGGAAGLELVTRLGRDKRYDVTLVEPAVTSLLKLLARNCRNIRRRA